MFQKLRKVMASLAAVVLMASSLNVTVLADDTAPLNRLEAGEYSLQSSLSCYTSAMGGIDFGAGMVTSTALNVDVSGVAVLAVDFVPSSFSMFGQQVTATIDTSTVPQYYNGSEWIDADYSAYVDEFTFPIAEATSYAVAVNLGGMQFGGPNATVTKADGKALEGIVTVDWDAFYDTVTGEALSEVAPGTYPVEAELSCYTDAMGGVDFTANSVAGATLTITEENKATLTLDVEPTIAKLVYGDMEISIDAKFTPQYFDGIQWVDAAYTGVVDSVSFPVTGAALTYDLALHISRFQFGGPNASVTSSGDSLKSVLTVDWSSLSTDSGNQDEEDNKDNDVTDTAVELTSGAYVVDLTWIPVMDAMMDPVVEIDAETMTFKIYNAADPETDKGSGSISYDEETGVYTMTYETGVKEENVGVTTTFTCDAESNAIEFTSALFYGSASFKNTDESGNFIPYKAVAEAKKDASFYDVDGVEGITLEDANAVLKMALGITETEVDYTLEDANICLKLALGIIEL